MPRGSRRGSSASFGKTNTVALQALQKLNPTQKLALLRTADKTLVRDICECALNVLLGNVKLSRAQKTRLVQHKQTLRQLAKKQGSWKSKKKILIQRGNGFLTLLLAPILGTLASSLFSK